jgi:hypothetical protein
MNFDKFGYYQAGNRKTYSRQEAIEFAGEKPIEWVFNDEVFSLYDWTTEPVDNINHFYNLRATQLRNDYDYIVLFYSGGYDSHNILKTFIDNNLHIDEIITSIPSLSIISTPTLEWNQFTSKQLERYKNQLVNTKIRLVEHNKKLIQIVSQNSDLLYSLNYKFTLHHLVKEEFKITFKEHRDCVERGAKIAYLYGIDKPAVSYNSQSRDYFVEFNESVIVNKILPETQSNKIQDIGYEFFYWAPECVSMMIKQAHMIKALHKIHHTLPSQISTLFNYTLYPRCVETNSLGFFNEEDYRKMFRFLNNKSNVPVTACVGGRDSWFYRMNHDISKKILDMVSSVSVNRKPALTKRYLIGQ